MGPHATALPQKGDGACILLVVQATLIVALILQGSHYVSLQRADAVVEAHCMHCIPMEAECSCASCVRAQPELQPKTCTCTA